MFVFFSSKWFARLWSSIFDTPEMPIKLPSGNRGRDVYEPGAQVRIMGHVRLEVLSR